MLLTNTGNGVAKRLYEETARNQSKTKLIKIRTLLSRFGYSKRSQEGAAQITLLLHQNNMRMYPSITKNGDRWELSLDDKVRLELIDSDDVNSPIEQKSDGKSVSPFVEAILRLEALTKKELRTEREVESKFVVPLLKLLGWSEEDRYDDKPVLAARGQKTTTLRADFIMYDIENQLLHDQALLVVEAKHEHRLTTKTAIDNAYRQARDYTSWVKTKHFMVTDGSTIRVYELKHTRDDELIFSCSRNNLVEKFEKLYDLVSKKALVQYHTKTRISIEELKASERNVVDCEDLVSEPLKEHKQSFFGGW